MRNKRFWLGLLVFVLALGMTLIGCDNGGGDGGGGGGSDGSGGTFSLTGIPNDYNNKYAVFYIYLSETVQLVGVQNVNVAMNGNEPNMSGTAVQIKDGKVSLPMWNVTYSGTVTKYSGNDANKSGKIMIFDRASVSEDYEPIVERYFESVTFSNGSASKTWSQGTDDWDDDEGGYNEGGGGYGGGSSSSVDPNQNH